MNYYYTDIQFKYELLEREIFRFTIVLSQDMDAEPCKNYELKGKMKKAERKVWVILYKKTVLEKEIYEVDSEPLRDLYGTLSFASNKCNQIAKRVNQTGVIKKRDIYDMNKSIDDFSKEVWDIHSLLLKRK